MSSFSDSNLVKKFAELNTTQQSIQTLSLWLIHHRKHSKTIIQVWYRELEKAKPSKRLTFIYLANDVIQNSKKKGPEFSKDFAHILPDAFSQAAKDADDKMKASLGRVINIWRERGVYDKNFTKRLRQCCMLSDAPGATEHSAKPAKPAKAEPAAKSEPKKSKKNEQEFSLRQEIEAMGAQLPANVDAEDLVQRLSDLENSASCDASVRERIAALPPEVSDISVLDKIQDRDSAEKLSDKVDEAALILNEYNRRLVSELEERKKVARMLRSFILSQQKQVSETEKSLKDMKSKLEHVNSVRQELMSHIKNLPDLTLLPDVTGGLAPLPSAGDLFSLGNH
ncbi:regulation of nuclear pre-mRNA domain-containing protein 1b [Plakobranchus ocellatus]|uniref:Regulation of nuclear pre-mRNA domain-containing protein 1b n=1 Tax=Plakobranchus ocellatus TaxID=259542 RepID=A0AAV3XVD1_9GAST|nr:regulation of nuclear pre-mRNA domain-containing protein 1b [Plakobranchus ocellatus]